MVIYSAELAGGSCLKIVRMRSRFGGDWHWNSVRKKAGSIARSLFTWTAQFPGNDSVRRNRQFPVSCLCSMKSAQHGCIWFPALLCARDVQFSRKYPGSWNQSPFWELRSNDQVDCRFIFSYFYDCVSLGSGLIRGSRRVLVNCVCSRKSIPLRMCQLWWEPFNFSSANKWKSWKLENSWKLPLLQEICPI